MESETNKIKNCEICGEQANIICFNCFNYYCDSCSKFIHEKKINKEHKKEEIFFSQLLDIQCEIHPKMKLEYFCFNENSK